MSKFGANASTRASTVLIQNITVIHVERNGDSILQEDASVLIKNGRIDSIGSVPTSSVAANALIVDGTGRWLLPGFIDTHVHFFQSGNPYTRPDGLDLTKHVPYERENARNHARLPVTLRTWLACGVTGVIDMGGPFWNFTVRERAQRTAEAPRVQVAGPLFSMVARPSLELDDPPILKVSSFADVRKLAERQLALKPDYLKVWFIHAPQDDLSAQEELVRTVGDFAHANGIPLAVHATELETAKAALRAGANILVHSVMDRSVDEEFLRMAKENRVIYEPTLYVERGYYEVFSRNWAPTETEKRLGDPQILEHMQDLERFSEADVPEKIRSVFMKKGVAPSSEVLERRRVAEQNLLEVWRRGITVTLGTDAGNIGTLHGPSVFREMALMVHAGLTPAQVLWCATANGAIAMGLEEQVGKVAVGFAADMVILNSNPLKNIENASDISHVIKAGMVFSVDELLSGRQAG